MNDSEDDLNISAPRNPNFRFIKPSPLHPSPDLTVDEMELGSEDNTNEGRRGSSRRSSPFLGEKSEDTMVASSRRSSPSLSLSTLNYGDDETNNLKKIDADLRIGVASKSTSRPRSSSLSSLSYFLRSETVQLYRNLRRKEKIPLWSKTQMSPHKLQGRVMESLPQANHLRILDRLKKVSLWISS